LTSAKLKAQVTERKNKFIKFNKLDEGVEVPADMLFASASGLDPHISPEAAQLQINRIAKARNFDLFKKQELISLVDKISEGPQLTCLGESRVNVLLLNIALDKLK